MYWNDLSSHLKAAYGTKVYKLSLSSGCTCPNRDGTLGSRGCVFCDGSGTFAAAGDIRRQLTAAKARVAAKAGPDARYIAYFQSFTNTYGPVDRLRQLYAAALEPEEVAALSIATRPDCLGPEVLALLAEMMMETARYIGHSGAEGIKFHLLHVLRGTDLAADWQSGRVVLPDLEEYISLLEDCVRSIPREMVIHRLTGDGAKRDLLAPLWSGDKKRVLNAIHAAFLRDDVEQGCAFW